ncbi:MAG: nucleoside-diphosphate sugar epimerase [Robiginitomaculum sp.]|nr:MAG: nucleoside-diphosphate sugar epimerase [Robiginitomaculum sp.]
MNAKTSDQSSQNKSKIASNNDKTCVFITGASGFIAKHCIIRLLNAGYEVRGSVRTLSRSKEVNNAIRPHASLEKLSFVALDLSKDEGWEEALLGCSYLLHIASPFPNSVPKHEDDLIIPARDGVLRALSAAAKAGVKRTVLTSSMAAIAYGHKDAETRVFTEDDWSDISGPVSAYVKSKTIAERAAWDFIESEAANGMELSVINPGAVLGPVLDVKYSTSGELVKKLINREAPACPQIGFSLIDVRDVAEAHIQAMIRPEAAGLRFFCINEFAWMIDVSKTLFAAGYKTPQKRLPNVLVSLLAMFDKTIALIKPELGVKIVGDNSRMKSVLGIEPRSLSEMSVSMADSMVKYGVVNVSKR